MISPLSWFIKRQKHPVTLVTANISESSYSYRYRDETFLVTNETIRKREGSNHGYCKFRVCSGEKYWEVEALTPIDALKAHLKIKD